MTSAWLLTDARGATWLHIWRTAWQQTGTGIPTQASPSAVHSQGRSTRLMSGTAGGNVMRQVSLCKENRLLYRYRRATVPGSQSNSRWTETQRTLQHAEEDVSSAAGDLDLLVALLAPLPVGTHDGGLVHLVDGHDDLGDAQRLGQLRMLPRLPAALEARLELGLRAARQSAMLEYSQTRGLLSLVQSKHAHSSA